MRAKLTQTSVKNLQPTTKDEVVWDTEMAGFGVKITPTGKKVFIVERRVGRGRGAPKRRITIGNYGAFTVDAAREAAKIKLREMEGGTDPVATQVAAIAAQIAAEKAASLEAEQAKERAFSSFAGRYIERRLVGKKSGNNKESIIRRRFVREWGDRDLAGITREDVADILDSIVDEGFGSAAWNALRTIRPLFKYAKERGLIQENPASNLRPDFDESSRERALSDDELCEVWNAAGELAYPFGSWVQLLALTGQRRNEVAGMRWAELNFVESIWTIPGERTKNEKIHIVHLTGLAVELLTRLPRISDEYVLTTTGNSAISGYSKAKQRLDTTITQARRQAAIKGGADPNVVQPMDEWRIHDLRRTLATGLAKMGVQPYVTDKILNHNPKAISATARIYNRHEYLPLRQAALEDWSQHVRSITAVKQTDHL